MHPNPTAVARQRRRIQACAENVDADRFFNLLTGPPLLDDLESLVPKHRERVSPPAETLTMLCLANGALLDAAEDPCKGKSSDEQTLFRGLLGALEAGDVLLGDAYFPTDFLLCERGRLGVDGVFKQYGARRRSTDFSLGERLGTNDHLIVWTKPKRPDWMSPDAYAEVPDTLRVRELYVGCSNAAAPSTYGVIMRGLLVLIAEPRVGLRPGRIEPRQIKRWHNTFPLMTKPRTEARAEVRLNGHPKKPR